MLRLAICDNEQQELDALYALVEEWAKKESDRKISCETFDSGTTLLDRISDGYSYDVYLLDIVMPVVSGIDLGRRIREKDAEAVIIYITSSTEFALDAYGVQAIRYLTKPVRRMI